MRCMVQDYFADIRCGLCGGEDFATIKLLGEHLTTAHSKRTLHQLAALADEAQFEVSQI